MVANTAKGRYDTANAKGNVNDIFTGQLSRGSL